MFKLNPPTILFYATLVCSAVALCCAANGTEPEEEEIEIRGKDLRELRNELYKFHKAPFSPDGVGKLPAEPSSDLEAKRYLLDELRSLVRLSQVKNEELMCRVSHFNQLRNFIVHYKALVPRIADYLLKIESEHFKQCEQGFDSKLKAAIDGLNPDDRENAVKLATKIDIPLTRGEDLGGSSLSGVSSLRSKLIVGALDYIQSFDSITQANLDQDKLVQVRNFGQLFKQLVGGVCERVVNKVSPATLVYGQISGVRLFDDLNTLPREWLKVIKVCNLTLELYNSNDSTFIRNVKNIDQMNHDRSR